MVTLQQGLASKIFTITQNFIVPRYNEIGSIYIVYLLPLYVVYMLHLKGNNKRRD